MRPIPTALATLATLATLASPALAGTTIGRLAFPDQDSYGAVVVVAGRDGEAPPVPLRDFAASVAAHGFPDTRHGAVTLVFLRRPGMPPTPAMAAIERDDGLPGTVVVRLDDDPDHVPLVDFVGSITPVADLGPVVAGYGALSPDGFALGDPGLTRDQANALGWTGSGDMTSTVAVASPDRYPTPTGSPIVLTCTVPHLPANDACTTTHILAAGATAMTDGPVRAEPPGPSADDRRRAATLVLPDDREKAAKAALALLPLLVQVR